ncbi:MAG TPA: hypothetical protein VHB21_16185, partial [Minicystis sp.]|nr:hypothetical protein [Minicystis sp.]
MASPIQRFIPRPRLHEIDRVAVAADPAETWQVIRSADLYQLGFVRTLFALRALPERAAGRLRGKHVEPLPRSARLDDVVKPGSSFHLLDEVPGRAFVAGAIGRFWQSTIPFVDVGPDAFASFAEPDYGKVAWSLEVHPRAAGGAWIAVDLRVDATDEAAWHHFQPYWALIGRFSRAIRRALLRSAADALGRPKPDAARDLPGDDVLGGARMSRTHAVTIEAPPARVWPWLVQMGCRRAGWYSLDRLDNGGVHSAERIVPELQHLDVG